MIRVFKIKTKNGQVLNKQKTFELPDQTSKNQKYKISL